MFLLMGVGAICYKRGIITDEGSGQMSTLIMTFVAPCVIIHSFCRAFDPAMLGKLITSFAMSVLLLAVSIGLTTLVFRKGTPDYADKRMCVIFSNNGFMALPLLQALYGDDGVFIGSINIVATNILIWTYGVWLLSRASGRASGGVNWRKILFNPGRRGCLQNLIVIGTAECRRECGEHAAGTGHPRHHRMPIAADIRALRRCNDINGTADRNHRTERCAQLLEERHALLQIFLRHSIRRARVDALRIRRRTADCQQLGYIAAHDSKLIS